MSCSSITTSPADLAVLTEHKIDAGSLAGFLNFRVLELHKYIKADKDPMVPGKTLSVIHQSGRVNSITRIRDIKETCPIPSCKKVVEVRYRFYFYASKLESVIQVQPHVELTPMDVHRIKEHQDFGENGRHVCPKLLSDLLIYPEYSITAECASFKVEDLEKFVQELEKKKDSPVV